MVYCNILWNGIIKDLGVLSTNIYEYREVEKHGLRLMALIEKHGLKPHDTHKYRRQPIT